MPDRLICTAGSNARGHPDAAAFAWSDVVTCPCAVVVGEIVVVVVDFFLGLVVAVACATVVSTPSASLPALFTSPSNARVVSDDGAIITPFASIARPPSTGGSSPCACVFVVIVHAATNVAAAHRYAAFSARRECAGESFRIFAHTIASKDTNASAAQMVSAG